MVLEILKILMGKQLPQPGNCDLNTRKTIRHESKIYMKNTITTELLEENRRHFLQPFVRFLRQDIKRTNRKRKITDRPDVAAIKNFCPSKESADTPRVGSNYLQNPV